MEIPERVHSHHLGVGERRRGFYHGREGQSMGMVLELGRGGVDNQDADNATLHWDWNPVRRPKAVTGHGSAGRRPSLACTGHGSAGRRPSLACTGHGSARPKADTPVPVRHCLHPGFLYEVHLVDEVCYLSPRDKSFLLLGYRCLAYVFQSVSEDCCQYFVVTVE